MLSIHCTKFYVHTETISKYRQYQILSTHCNKFKLHTVPNAKYTLCQMMSTHWTKCSGLAVKYAK